MHSQRPTFSSRSVEESAWTHCWHDPSYVPSIKCFFQCIKSETLSAVVYSPGFTVLPAHDSHIWDLFYRQLRCEVTGVQGVITDGGLNVRWQLRKPGGDILSRFFLTSFSTSCSLKIKCIFLPSSSCDTHLCLSACRFGFCMETTRGSITPHISSVILVSSPRDAGELFILQQRPVSPALLYCTSYWSSSHCTVLESLHLLPLPFITLRLNNLRKSQRGPAQYFLSFFGIIAQTGTSGTMSLFFLAWCQTKPLEMDYGRGPGSCIEGAPLRLDGARLTWLRLNINHDRVRNP